MLAQQQTEKIIELLNNRVESKFEKKPINENIKNLGFKPVKLIDFAKKELDPPPQEGLQSEGQSKNPIELAALTSGENDEKLNTEEIEEPVQDFVGSLSENSEVSNATDDRVFESVCN